MSKKLLALLLIMLLTISMMAGCVSGNKDAKNDISTNANTDAKTSSGQQSQVDETDEFAKYQPKPDVKYTIEWLGSHSNAPVPEDADMVLYWENKYNVDFKLWYVERSRWDEILNVRLAGGEVPDVLTAESPDIIRSYYDQNLILELPKELLQKFTPKIYQTIEEVAQQEGLSPWMVTTIDGKNYGIPKFNENGKYHQASIWRKDWLENVGITKVPETLEEFEIAFYKFVREDPDRNGKDDTYALSSGYQSYGGFSSIFGAFGYIPQFWSIKDDKMVYGAIQPEMKEALTLLAKWYADGLINPEFITGENRGGHWSISHDFIEGKIGYTNNPPYYHIAPPGVYGTSGGRMYRTMAETHDMEKTLAYGRPPIGYNGKSGDVRWGLINGNGLVFNQELENEPDKLGKILTIIEDMCANFENYVLMTYGIEGKHYKVENGNYIMTLPEGVSTEEYGIGMVFVAWTGVGFDRKINPAQFEFGDKHAAYTNTYSNQLFTSLPSTNLYWDELDKLQKETYIRIITGEKSPDEFDNFVAQWLQRGGEQLQKEANEWYSSVKSVK